MFFEATYVPSPPLSIASIDDDAETHVEVPEPDVEPASDKPVDHLIFVIHVSQNKLNNMVIFTNTLRTYKKRPVKYYKPRSLIIMCVLNLYPLNGIDIFMNKSIPSLTKLP
ncbi:uncharacterized protein EV154DRAFT_122361 [Mucor mucedo]|uniref:uncharacterized protein n=1 Tax=Mucor mucedo TaxID=29922 RepID=UPI002220738C|nr:uncharacterized protein EV154DRAFT_122361 [Mucor mucedo]KAI7870487.1 hypothetical protein EV154DRAFT_122361 [Mucor mucedo]